MSTNHQASFLMFSTLKAFALNSVEWISALKCSHSHQHTAGLQDFHKCTELSLAKSDGAIT